MIDDATLTEKETWFKRLGDPWLRHYREAIAEIRRLQEEIPQVRQRTLNWAAKNYGCQNVGPDCPGRCIARCEDLPNLRMTLAAHQAVMREMAGALALCTEEALGNPHDEYVSIPMTFFKEAQRVVAHPLVVAARKAP